MVHETCFDKECVPHLLFLPIAEVAGLLVIALLSVYVF